MKFDVQGGLVVRIVRAFTDHPATVGESYFEHMRCALGFSFTMMRSAVCCAIHAFLPFLFTKTGSSAIEDLYRRMVRQRSKLAAAPVSVASQANSVQRDRAAA